eukprot:7076769-Ditylum_brightwellii.AAC.1
MASLVMDNGSSSRLSRTSSKERVLLIDSVLKSSVDSVVVKGEEGLPWGGLDIDFLATGGKDGAIAVASSCMGEMAETFSFFVMVAGVQGRKEG